ncbi:MAG: hypothetical protein ACTSVV_03580 [Promethearchaeota archaeon]
MLFYILGTITNLTSCLMFLTNKPYAINYVIAGMLMYIFAIGSEQIKSKELIGYKVTDIDKKSFFEMGFAQVQYELNKWVYPKEGCGPLGLFTDESGARTFLRMSVVFNGSRIFKCKYKQSKVRIFSNQDHAYKGSIFTKTDFADKIKLLEELE